MILRNVPILFENKHGIFTAGLKLLSPLAVFNFQFPLVFAWEHFETFRKTGECNEGKK